MVASICVTAGKSSAGRSHGTGPMPMPKAPTKATTLKMAQAAVHAFPGLERATVRSAIETVMPKVERSSKYLRAHGPGGA